MHRKKREIFRGIEDIFSHNIKKAQLYQDIVTYSVRENKSSFKLRELVKYLISHNREYRLFYQGSHLSLSRRIEHTIPTVNNKLNDLIDAKFFSKGVGRAEKIDIDISVFSLTPSGQLLAWLIEANDEKIEQKAKTHIFEIILSYLKKKNNSRASFLLLFFTKCMNKNVFAEDPLYFLTQPRPRVYTESTMLELFLDFPNTIYWVVTLPQIFLESLNEMKEEDKKSLYFQFKTELEVVYNNYYANREWETARYTHSADYTRVTVPGYCDGCKSSSPMLYDTEEYFSKMSSAAEYDPTMVIYGDCLKCGAKQEVIGPLVRVPWTSLVRR